jgi:pescadillo protein
VTGNYSINEAEEAKIRKRALLKLEKKRKEEKEREEMAEVLLSQKKRKLLDRIKFGQRMKQSQIDKLWNKRRKLESGEAKLVHIPSDNATVIEFVTKKTQK